MLWLKSRQHKCTDIGKSIFCLERSSTAAKLSKGFTPYLLFSLNCREQKGLKTSTSCENSQIHKFSFLRDQVPENSLFFLRDNVPKNILFFSFLLIKNHSLSFFCEIMSLIKFFFLSFSLSVVFPLNRICNGV